MSVYERDWYRKESERRQRRQEGADAMWNEVEPSHREKKQNASQNRQAAGTPKPKEKVIPSCCPLCDYTTRLRVPYPQLREYSYTCPACKTKRSVSTGDKKNSSTTTYTVLGIIALIIYALSQWSNIAGLFT